MGVHRISRFAPHVMELLRARASLVLLLAAVAAACGGGGGGSKAIVAAGSVSVLAPAVLATGEPATLRLAAPASLAVASAEFFANGQSLGIDALAPFEIAFVPSAPPGTVFSLTAVATDASGARHGGPAAIATVGLGGSSLVFVSGVTEVDPAVHRVGFSLLGGAGATFGAARLSFSTDGGATIRTGTLVGADGAAPLAASPVGAPHFVEWNAALDLGTEDAPSVTVGVALQDGSGIWRAAASAPFGVSIEGAIAGFRERLVPNLADVLDHDSPSYAKVLSSAVTTQAFPGVLRTDFVFDSTWFAGSGAPSNLCAGCPTWKKDVWPDVAARLYLPAGASPQAFVLVSPLEGKETVWSASYAALFPDLADGTIAGEGNPALAEAGSAEESIAKLVRELSVGVITGDWAQAGPAAVGFTGITVLSFDQALRDGDPRWSIFAGMAEAQMRALTAVEILRDAAPGSLRFALHGVSKNAWAACIAAAADPRVEGAALSDGPEVGRWALMGELAAIHHAPGIESAWAAATTAVLAAGYPLAQPFDFAGFASIPTKPFGAPFARDLDPARQIALGWLQGKRYLIQSATADHVADLHLRKPWFDDAIRRRYPGPSLRMHVGANADHASAGPQAIRNLRSFAATALLGRPRADVVLASAPGATGTVFRATVENPDPARIVVQRVWLRWSRDGDGDFRLRALPPCAGATCCTTPGAGSVLCFSETAFHLNRSWASIPMTPTGLPGEWRAEVKLSTLVTPSEPRLAFFAEVEDVAVPAAFPAIDGPSRAYATSAPIFVP